MKYLSDYELEQLSPSELLNYRQDLIQHKAELKEEVYTMIAVFKALQNELQVRMTEMEISCLEAEEARLNQDWDQTWIH